MLAFSFRYFILVAIRDFTFKLWFKSTDLALMKLRIKDNSVRLRLAQSEVIELAERGTVESVTRFPGGATVRYGLKKTEEGRITLTWKENTLLVLVPEDKVQIWTESDLVGFSERINMVGSDPLDVVIEKDFKCLTDRPGEDESDLYPNPLESH